MEVIPIVIVSDVKFDYSNPITIFKKKFLPFDLDLDLAGAYVGPDASK